MQLQQSGVLGRGYLAYGTAVVLSPKQLWPTSAVQVPASGLMH
jgi:hypothetical protein